MSKIFTLKLLPNDDRVFFIAGDWHLLQQNEAAIDILIGAAELIPLERRFLIINGDFLDLDFLMKKHDLYPQWICRKDGLDEYFVPLFNQTISAGNKLLDRLLKTFASIILGFGNHETKRVNEFLLQCPIAYKHNFNISAALNLQKRGIFSFPYNTYLDIGGVAITHGQRCGANALKQHFYQSCKTVIVSHLHTAMMHSFESRGETYHAFSTPAMCNKPDENNATYMENRDNRWDVGFTTLALDGNLHFINHHIIVKNSLRLSNGQLLIGGNYGKA